MTNRFISKIFITTILALSSIQIAKAETVPCNDKLVGLKALQDFNQANDSNLVPVYYTEIFNTRERSFDPNSGIRECLATVSGGNGQDGVSVPGESEIHFRITSYSDGSYKIKARSIGKDIDAPIIDPRLFR